jgi:hypothetical protein
MNWTKLSVATILAAALFASPAMAYADPPPPPSEPLPMPLPFGSQNVPQGVEVYCPNAVWVLRRCHQCAADPAHKCWDR